MWKFCGGAAAVADEADDSALLLALAPDPSAAGSCNKGTGLEVFNVTGLASCHAQHSGRAHTS